MSTQTPNPARAAALKRLQRDYKEMLDNPIPTIAARPVSDENWFEWHANIVGTRGTPYQNAVFHLIICMDEQYPKSPPQISLKTTVHRSHVFGEWLCLDMLEVYHFEDKLYSGKWGL